MIKRITRFPMDMSECTYANYLFSPSFMFFLDFDKNKNKYVIRETLSQKSFVDIPTGFINIEMEDVTSVA